MQIFWRICGETFGDSVKTVMAMAIIAKLSQPTSELYKRADIKCRRESRDEIESDSDKDNAMINKC